jgi:hypothetical protein
MFDGSTLTTCCGLHADTVHPITHFITDFPVTQRYVSKPKPTSVSTCIRDIHLNLRVNVLRGHYIHPALGVDVDAFLNINNKSLYEISTTCFLLSLQVLATAGALPRLKKDFTTECGNKSWITTSPSGRFVSLFGLFRIAKISS